MSFNPRNLRSRLVFFVCGLGLAAVSSAQAPTAEFSATPTLGVAPLAVSFTDFSSGSVSSYAWAFGDAGTSTIQNPSHTYTSAGTYSVGLTATGPGGSDGEMKPAYITVIEPAPMADFVSGPTAGAAPMSVAFSDASTGAVTGWSWSFGDGSTSILQNPTHLYSTAGTYTVGLTVSGPGGIDTEIKVNYVVVSVPAPVADFSATPTSGNVPLSVQFTSLATGDVSSGSWSFGDTGTSLSQSPAHVYVTAGTYSVSFDVTGPGGTDNETKVDYIVVAETLPVAAFSGSPLTGTAPLVVSFADSSGGTVTSWAWTFGDGGTSSLQNPNHSYTSTGSYTVILTATGPSGSDQQIEVDYVVVTPPAPVADFSGTPLTGVAPLTVNFTDTSTGTVTGHSWSFGDSATSNAVNPSHVYSDPGVYSVSVTATGPGGLDSETKMNYVTVIEPPPVAAFTGSPSAGVAPHNVSFTDFSEGNILTYTWDFGDSGSSTLSDPAHVYASPGSYSVSLTVTSAGGVDSDTRVNYIRVAEPEPVADFAGTPSSGVGSLTTTFSDLSTGAVTAYSWNFGDGGLSFVAAPVHTYSSPGTYTVTLTVGGPGGIDTNTKADYITVAYPVPVANFTAMPTTGVHPLTASFTDLSTGIVSSWSWDFGDLGTSSLQNPTHTYSSAGSYTVTLTATGPGGSDPETKTGYIVVAEQEPIADFVGIPANGVAPLSVAFTDLSSGGPTTSRAWTFGDGGTSTITNPVHSYATAGTFTVSLTVTGPGGVDTQTRLDYVTVTIPAPVAGFTGTPLTGIAPLTVAFSDATTGVVSGWSWSFGDFGTSAMTNPTHTYTDPGTYTVVLTAVGPGGSDTDTQTGLVVVSEPPPGAQFSAVPQTGTAPLSVFFTDHSTGNVTNYAWTFGDAGSSSAQHPSHTYSSSGTYTVSLTVNSSGGVDTENKLNYITVGEPAPLAEFSGTPLSGTAPLGVTFSDASVGVVTSWSWNFGDLTGSSTQNPVKIYPASGIYGVSLTVTGPGGVDTEIKTDYVVVGTPAPAADFIGTPTSGVAPLTVLFSDTSVGVASSWFWTFGDGGTSTAQNPTKVYNSSGSYSVALTATGPGGSDLESKTDYIVVNEPAPSAVFTGTPTSGLIPLTVNFTDASTGVISSFAWVFGDGGTSTLQNPSHTYNSAGAFTVSLTVTGPGGSDTLTLTDYIAVGNLPPVADFSGTPLSGVAPLTVNFTNLTTGVATSYAWTFGDGGVSSTENPSHLYGAAGTYTVELTSTGPGGADVESKPGYVSVLEPPPLADFIALPLSGSAPLIVNFTDASFGAVTAWAWSFGDAGTSTGQNPGHLYSTPGTFTVSLTVSSSGGVDSETKVDYITVDLSLDDGSFENQLAGGAPSAPWSITGGSGHVIQPDSGTLADGGFPSDAVQWADLSTAGSNAATPPSNPGGVGSLPAGGVGISQTFTFSAISPVLLFDAAFILGEAAMSAGSNDFMSVDVSDGSTHYNLYHADTFSTFPNVSIRHGLPMTDSTQVQINLRSVFPAATSATVLTLSVQMGNGGNALNTSRGFVDNFLLGLEACSIYSNGNGSNPSIYVGSAPVVGGSWTANIDTTAFPSTAFTFVFCYSGGASINTPLGQLLINLGSSPFFTSGQVTGAQHSLSVPNNLNFLGISGVSQGFLFAGGTFFQVTNAATLKLGLQTLDPSPTAAFNASPTTGVAPLSVSFFDQSSGSITSHFWDFGDGNTSPLQNPVHTYNASGTYSVLLVVSGPGGYDTSNRYDLIVVP